MWNANIGRRSFQFGNYAARRKKRKKSLISILFQITLLHKPMRTTLKNYLFIWLKMRKLENHILTYQAKILQLDVIILSRKILKINWWKYLLLQVLIIIVDHMFLWISGKTSSQNIGLKANDWLYAWETHGQILANIRILHA